MARRPRVADDGADGGHAHRIECSAFDRVRGVQRNLPDQARLLILAHEGHAKPARVEGIHRIRLGRAQFRQLGREVELVQRRVDLVDDLAFVEALQPRDLVLAADEVGRQGADALDALVGEVLSHRLGRHVALPGSHEQVGLALRTCHGRRACNRADERHVRRRDLGLQRHQDVRRREAGDDIDLVALDQLAQRRQRGFGLLLLVFLDHGGGHASQLAAELFEREREAVELIASHVGRRAAQRREKAHLDVACAPWTPAQRANATSARGSCFIDVSYGLSRNGAGVQTMRVSSSPSPSIHTFITSPRLRKTRSPSRRWLVCR